MTEPLVEHFFTVDVEDYFQVNAFESSISRGAWDSYPPRLERNVDRLLELLHRRSVLGTFFTLGWVAQRHPGVVRRISEAGHEIASHGFWHRRVTELTPGEFREDVRNSRQILEDLTGQRVYGYRAPSFSIVPGREWALDILVEEGYRYDSSLFPIRRTGYGYPGTDPVPHVLHRAAGPLLELPPATVILANMRLPAAGGGYFRQFPYSLFSHAFRSHAEAGVSAMFYIHPWELDPEQPRLSVPLIARFRHYTGLRRVQPRLQRLLEEFRFTSVARRFGVNLGGESQDGTWADLLPA